MRVDQASSFLREMYDKAPDNEKALSIHLFGIIYAEQLEGLSKKEIVMGEGLPVSYQTELNKGMNLARYVELKR